MKIVWMLMILNAQGQWEHQDTRHDGRYDSEAACQAAAGKVFMGSPQTVKCVPTRVMPSGGVPAQP